MKLEITIESVAAAIHISWVVAHQANNDIEWNSWWERVNDQLKAMWDLVNWSRDLSQHNEALALMDEIMLLRNISQEVRYNWSDKQTKTGGL